jgi:hypothetical protein
MDGSEVNQANLGALSLWAAKYNKNGNDNVNLLLSSNSCAAWKKDIQNINCETLPVAVDSKKGALVNAFGKFIVQSGAQAGLSQTDETPVAPVAPQRSPQPAPRR